MIPIPAVNAYRAGSLLLMLALAGCVVPFRVPVASRHHRIVTDGYFSVGGGPRQRRQISASARRQSCRSKQRLRACPTPLIEPITVGRALRLPYRDWLPQGAPRAVVLALHGFNDSRDAWELAAPMFTSAGIAVFAPDQRGFGAAPGRGFWPGTAALVGDARRMVAILHRRYPGVRVTLMGESMGGAIALLLGAQRDRDVASYVVISPAVWGGDALAPALRISLAVADTFAPWVRLTGRQVAIRASDNIRALIDLSDNPLSIHATRIGTLAGLTRMMGRALAACARFAPPHALILYGGHDQLIPKQALASCWEALPRQAGIRTAYYPADYHLMLLDHERATPGADIVSFILHPDRPLRSDAETDATIFLAQH